MRITELISTFFISSGPGGVVIMAVVSLASGIYFFLIRWILRGGEPDQEERYRFK